MVKCISNHNNNNDDDDDDDNDDKVALVYICAHTCIYYLFSITGTLIYMQQFLTLSPFIDSFFLLFISFLFSFSLSLFTLSFEWINKSFN